MKSNLDMCLNDCDVFDYEHLECNTEVWILLVTLIRSQVMIILT